MKYILNGFPDVKHAFAYGSGVFRQPGLYPSGSGDDSRHNGPMIDLVFAVDDPVAWHREVRPNFSRD